MALINDNKKVSEMTKEEKLAREKNRIISLNTNIFNQMNSQHYRVFNMVWNNNLGLTPQEVLDEFGTEAVSLFEFSQNIQNLLAAADSNYEPLTTPNEYQINADGTVTIGEERV